MLNLMMRQVIENSHGPYPSFTLVPDRTFVLFKTDNRLLLVTANCL